MKTTIAALLTAISLFPAAVRAQTPTPTPNYEPYSFQTLAGLPPGSVDGKGSHARFDYPQAVAVDASNNVYVADWLNFAVRKISPTGEVTTFAGALGAKGYVDGPSAAARFTAPAALAFDGAGTLYVADGRVVRKITTDGTVSTFAGGTRGNDSAQPFRSLAGVTVTPDGNVYVADGLDQTIRKITPAGQVSTFAGKSGVSGYADGSPDAALFNQPMGITFDPNGAHALFVADAANRVIRIVTEAGTGTFAGGGNHTPNSPAYDFPAGVALDSARNLYVADAGANSIIVANLGSNSAATTFAGSPDSVSGSADGVGTAARFSDPNGLARDAAGNLYVSEGANSTVRKVTPGASVTTLAGLASAGSADGAASAARFARPTGLALGLHKEIYIADVDNSTIRKITSDGIVTTIGKAGTPGNADGDSATARFNGPNGVTVDPAGNVYVADTNNNSIRKITPAGKVTTVTNFGAHGLNPHPESLVSDSSGNIYVAGLQDHTIYKVTAAGQFSIFAGQPNQDGSVDGVGQAARFDAPSAITIDESGSLFVTQLFGGIRKITSAAEVTTLNFGARLLRGIAVDTAGNFYLTGQDDVVCKATPDGTITILGGTFSGRFAEGTGAGAQFSNPWGIAVDASGKLYVADSQNNVIRTGAKATAAVNISTRMQVGTEPDELFAGFIVTGSVPKKVIIRAIGPSIQANGQPLPGTLQDPMLELHGTDGSVIRSNDDWQTNQSQAINDTGIAPTDPRESAIIETLQPGNYTAVVRGKQNSTGIGVVEVYDLESGSAAQMAQISTRGKVLTDADVMIGGFILSGLSNANVLIRAIGPELTAKGVAGALQDPTLELHDSNGATLAANDNWRTTQEQEISATGAQPTDDRESAILQTVPPGSYTAIVRGSGGTTGVGLVEIYVLE